MTGSKKQRGRPNKLMNKFIYNYISRSVRISGRLRSDWLVFVQSIVTKYLVRGPEMVDQK